ncbi:MAG: recombination protein [Myxococcales bacterium]|nr:recombination protein [Myxococcales bacterium]
MKDEGSIQPVDVPQADRLDKIRALLEAVRRRDSILEIIESTKLSARHIDYYIDAAEVLGLLVKTPGAGASLTPAGEQLLKYDASSPDYREALAQQIARSPTLQQIAPDLLSTTPPGREALAEQITKLTGLASSTADRRAGTLLSWRRQLLPYQTSFAAIAPASPSPLTSVTAETADARAKTSHAKSSLPEDQPPKAPSSWAPNQPTYRGQIRQSQINQLLEKARKHNYGKYLAKVILQNARGFVQQEVSFAFPVTALIGPNGGGKTTILGAAACAYDGVKPRQFFSKSGLLDESMKDWSIEYEIVDNSVNSKSTFRRTASFKDPVLICPPDNQQEPLRRELQLASCDHLPNTPTVQRRCDRLRPRYARSRVRGFIAATDPGWCERLFARGTKLGPSEDNRREPSCLPPAAQSASDLTLRSIMNLRSVPPDTNRSELKIETNSTVTGATSSSRARSCVDRQNWHSRPLMRERHECALDSRRCVTSNNH